MSYEIDLIESIAQSIKDERVLIDAVAKFSQRPLTVYANLAVTEPTPPDRMAPYVLVYRNPEPVSVDPARLGRGDAARLVNVAVTIVLPALPTCSRPDELSQDGEPVLSPQTEAACAIASVEANLGFAIYHDKNFATLSAAELTPFTANVQETLVACRYDLTYDRSAI